MDNNGVDLGVEESTAQDATAVEQSIRQPEQPAKVNLDELAEFRQWKIETDKRFEKERIDRLRLEQQYQRQLEQQQQALREQQMAGMDDYERAKYEAQEARQEAEYWRQQAALVQTQTAREKALSAIAAEMSVPLSAIEEATSEGEAWRLGWTYKRQTDAEQAKQRDQDSEEKRAQREQKRTANRVDTGAGAPITPSTDWERTAADLRKSKDALGLFRHALGS